MRIISGERRGAVLKTPEGEGTRPLRDRIREALFSILRPEIHGRVAVDAFAGSGAVGLEALSNGAAFCTFIEPGAAALAAIRANIVKLRYEDRSALIAGETPAAFARLKGHEANLLFLMPPYHSSLCISALAAATKGRFAEDTLAVCEIHRDEPMELPASWIQVDRRDYGITRLIFAQRRTAP